MSRIHSKDGVSWSLFASSNRTAAHDRGLCPRPPGIFRFTPAAWHENQPIPPHRRCHPCHWTAASLGAIGRNNAFGRPCRRTTYDECLTIMPLAQSDKCRRVGGSAPQSDTGRREPDKPLLVILSRRRRIWPANERSPQFAAHILHYASLRSG